MKLLFVLGTRPEAIKLAPIILKLRREYKNVSTQVCITAQHRNLLDEVINYFSIPVDFDLNLMLPNQTLSTLTSRIIEALDKIVLSEKPDIIIVQGDTTTAMSASLVGFYNKIRIAHVEAGLRSGIKMEPFPEEVNRKIISHLADFHFAPTDASKSNLVNEKVGGIIEKTGNTVIDALFLGIEKNKNNPEKYLNIFPFITKDKRYILTTVHRRENFGQPLSNICDAIIKIKENYADVEFVLPMHPNPNVQINIIKRLGNIKGIHLIQPLPYDSLIWMIQNCYFVLTDSGGIQEEAPSLAKPVVVMRNVTERMEGVLAGNAILAGTSSTVLFDTMDTILKNQSVYLKMAYKDNPYGDGKSTDRIIDLLLNTPLDKA
jgi:UDP-N-acetylglucosamine 2-epimerase (non-hydrolysing)